MDQFVLQHGHITSVKIFSFVAGFLAGTFVTAAWAEAKLGASEIILRKSARNLSSLSLRLSFVCLFVGMLLALGKRYRPSLGFPDAMDLILKALIILMVVAFIALQVLGHSRISDASRRMGHRSTKSSSNEEKEENGQGPIS